MNNLLETHTSIWFIEGDSQFSERAKTSIEKTKKSISLVSQVYGK